MVTNYHPRPRKWAKRLLMAVVDVLCAMSLIGFVLGLGYCSFQYSSKVESMVESIGHK